MSKNYNLVLKNIKLDMMKEFIEKINEYGVNKFLKNGIPNSNVIYQIKNYDETVRIETVEKYLNKIHEIME